MKRRLYVDWLIFYKFFDRDNNKFAAIYALTIADFSLLLSIYFIVDFFINLNMPGRLIFGFGLLLVALLYNLLFYNRYDEWLKSSMPLKIKKRYNLYWVYLISSVLFSICLGLFLKSG